jgi:hypothetical protein
MALDSVDVGIGFVDRATDVCAVGFLKTYRFYAIGICITPETIL